MKYILFLATFFILVFNFGCKNFGGKKDPQPPVDKPTTGGNDAVKNRHLALQDVSKAVLLKQNWTDEEANWFYNISQGSHLVPYSWFLHLEQADAETLFRDDKNLHQLGFIPRSKSIGNPDGLPVGFAKDPSDGGDNSDWLGLNCAACHTVQVNYKDVG